MEERIRVLSMDLSLSFPAFAIIDFSGGKAIVVDIKYCDNKKCGKLSHGERLHRIANVLRDIAEEYPDINVVVREKGFSRFAATTQSLFKVVGVSDLEVFRIFGITEIDELSPTTVKKYITGNGKADKDGVEAGVRKLLDVSQKDLAFKTDDCSDAVAVGFSWLIKEGHLKGEN